MKKLDLNKLLGKQCCPKCGDELKQIKDNELIAGLSSWLPEPHCSCNTFFGLERGIKGIWFKKKGKRGKKHKK